MTKKHEVKGERARIKTSAVFTQSSANGQDGAPWLLRPLAGTIRPGKNSFEDSHPLVMCPRRYLTEFLALIFGAKNN